MARRRRRPLRPGPAPGPNPPRWSECVYLRLAPADLAYLKFILEAEDNLAYVTVVDKFAAVARLVYSPGQAAEARDFLDRARGEIGLAILDAPGTPCQA